MADAGFNLVHCGNVAELDRAQAAGMMGWVSVPLELGADNDALRRAVEAVRDHPALAVWEGPDEVVWSFTAGSELHRSGVYKAPDEWWQQTPFAVERSEAEAKKILPKLREGCQWVLRADRWFNDLRRRCFWMYIPSRMVGQKTDAPTPPTHVGWKSGKASSHTPLKPWPGARVRSFPLIFHAACIKV